MTSSNTDSSKTTSSKSSGRAGGWTLSKVASILETLSTNTLVFVIGLIFVLDLAIPDALPFVDEVVLGVLTILLARWRSKKSAAAEDDGADAAKPPPKNVTPPAG